MRYPLRLLPANRKPYTAFRLFETSAERKRARLYRMWTPPFYNHKLRRESYAPAKWFNVGLRWKHHLTAAQVRRLRSVLPDLNVYPDGVPIQQWPERWPSAEVSYALLQRMARIVGQPVEVFCRPSNLDCDGTCDEARHYREGLCPVGSADGCQTLKVELYSWQPLT
jgi:hypothetical protein